MPIHAYHIALSTYSQQRLADIERSSIGTPWPSIRYRLHGGASLRHLVGHLSSLCLSDPWALALWLCSYTT